MRIVSTGKTTLFNDAITISQYTPQHEDISMCGGIDPHILNLALDGSVRSP